VSQSFLEDCISDLGRDKGSYQDFQETFCKRCRNIQCTHAQWSKDKFGDRVIKQPDRMFHPHQADPKAPKYAHLADFASMMQEAIKLEIADRKGDWSVPEVPILDGRQETSKLVVTNSVDEAIQKLAQAKGQEIKLPDPMVEVTKEFISETNEQMKQYEEKTEPESSDRNTTPASPSSTPPVIQTPQVPFARNTEVPKEGIMIGGGSAPVKVPALDPWAPPPPKGKVVPVGGKVVLGGKDE
jgi:hypothetical protein